jgi:type IV secretory pathway VirB4 component
LILDRVHHAAHRVSTAHLQVVYPGIAQASLGSRGAYIGRDYHGGSFCYDAWELYARGDVTGPNMLVVGQIGRGKSAFVKSFVYRQLVFGRRAVMLDPKGENAALCHATGTEPIELRPGGGVRLNPLDTVPSDGRTPEDVLQSRTGLVAALLGASLGRAVTPDELIGVEAAIVDATEQTRVPTLRAVVEAMLTPGQRAAERARTTVEALASATRTAALGLRRLVDGDLRGMFDAETSGSVRLDAPLVSFDLSALYQSPALGVLMICVAAWLQERLRDTADCKRIVVLDEAWAVLSNLETAEWLAASYKLARSHGVQYIAVLHRLSDLLAAGSEGSRQLKLARGLLSDSETVVAYSQPPAEIDATRDLLELNELEAEYLTHLPRSVALWKVGQRSFLVEHVLAAGERAFVDTDSRMRVGGAAA